MYTVIKMMHEFRQDKKYLQIGIIPILLHRRL